MFEGSAPFASSASIGSLTTNAGEALSPRDDPKSLIDFREQRK